MTKRQKPQRAIAVWRNGGFSASYDSFLEGSSAVLRLNFCAKNPPLRQAAKRYGPLRKSLINSMSQNFITTKGATQRNVLLSC